MWKINAPDIGDPMEELDQALTYISGEKKHSLSQAERETLISVYNIYRKNEGNAHRDFEGHAFSVNSKNAMYSAYSEVQENGRLKDLRSRILLNASRCPICSISSADELDHYLPRSLFKILSIYVLNLQPICHKCNNKKRTLSGENEKEKFPHLYFVKLPSVRFFFAVCTLRTDILVVNFYIKNIPELTEKLYNQLCYQIKRVNLNTRLAAEVNVLIQSLSHSFDLVFLPQRDGQAVSDFLRLTAQSFTTSFGLNDWRTALVESLSTNVAFCNGGYSQIVSRLTPPGIHLP